MSFKEQSPWYRTRLFMLVCWVLWVLTFFLTVTVFQAVLQIQVVAQVFQDKERVFNVFNEDLAQIYPLESLNREKIDEMLLRYYLELRYTRIPDVAEMERRWGPYGVFSYFSSPASYQAFLKEYPSFEKIANMKPQTIDILSVQRENGYYSVDCDLYTFDRFLQWQKNPKRLVVEFNYWPSRAVLAKRFANPNGFVVIRVDESERK